MLDKIRYEIEIEALDEDSPLDPDDLYAFETAEHEAAMIAQGYTPDPIGDGWFTYPDEGNEEAAIDGQLSARPHMFRNGACLRTGCDVTPGASRHPADYGDCQGARYGYGDETDKI